MAEHAQASAKGGAKAQQDVPQTSEACGGHSRSAVATARGKGLETKLKGYTLGSFLKCSSHFRLDSIMLWTLTLSMLGTREWERCRRWSCSLGKRRRAEGAGEEGRAGRKWMERVAEPSTSSLFLSLAQQHPCEVSSNSKVLLWRGKHQLPRGKAVAALHPLSGHLMQNLLKTFTSVCPRPVPARNFPLSAEVLTQHQLSGWPREQTWLWDLQLGPGMGRREYLTENKMNRKLITGLNNRLSVSPMGCPSPSRCCSAGTGEEGGHSNQTKSSMAKTGQIPGLVGHRKSRVSPQARLSSQARGRHL